MPGEPLIEDISAPPAPAGILLVDDRAENLAALEAVLEPLGEPVISVGSGEAALRVLLHREVAVVLLDVRMSGLDGVETARLIRSRPATRHIPIIFLTALPGDVAQVELAYATGAVDYVIKPFEPSILRAKVTAFVALSRERAERLHQQRARARAEAAARAVRTLQSLSDVALAHLELEPLVNELLERACVLFDATGGALLIPDVAGEELRLLATRGLEPAGELTVDGALEPLLERRGAALVVPEDPAWLALGPFEAGALVAVPLRERDDGPIRGLLLLAGERRGTFDQADLSLLELAGERITIAIDHAQRFEHQRDLVETLQRSLLPDRLPVHPRVEFAARYRPGESGSRIGGDWYDAIALDDRRIALMIGDVVGHGVPAAARMGELRNALRAYATEGHGPAAALHRLDRLVQATVGTEMVATVLVGMLDLTTRSLTLARAGHPPPLVRGADGTVRVLDSGSTLPLGVIGSAAPSEFTYALADGDTVILYTDGLVERRSEPFDAGVDRLMTVLGSGPGGASASCDTILTRLIGDQAPGDDVAVLAAHVRPPEAGPLELDLPARAESVSTARHRLRDWLRDEAPEIDAVTGGDLEVAFCEACTNVVRHAYGPGDACFRARARRDGAILELSVEDEGQWRTPRAGHGGRGLDLIRALCNDVAVDHGSTGTRVVMRWLTPA